MSREGACVLGLLLGLIGGCASVTPDRAGAQSAFAARLPEGYVQLDVALLERPLGDSYLNGELWDYTDETIVGLEARPRLDANGLRVGQVVGMPPGGLQALLCSPRACLNPRRWMLPTAADLGDAPRPRLRLGPIAALTRFVIRQQGQAAEIDAEHAEHQLEIAPGLTADGRIRLGFTPRLEYGEPLRTVVVPPDRTDFVVQVAKPSRTFPGARFDVTLAPNEYLVIGARDERPESLGYQAFTSETERQPTQRLLVIRATRATSPVGTEAPTLEDLARGAGPPPLALQAMHSAVRANGQ